MILVLIVPIYHVAVVVIRKVIAIAPLNRWSWQITAYNTRSTKFALRVMVRVSFSVCCGIKLSHVFVAVGRANFVRVRETLCAILILF